MNLSLNENIKQLRIQSGLNQVQFAKIMNVTKQCVSNWENDNVLPSIEMLVKMVDYFKVSIDALLGRETGNMIDASGLTDEQAAHIRLVIRDLCQANKSV